MQEKKPAAATELCVECEAWKWYYNLTILRSRNPKVAQHLGMGKAGKWGGTFCLQYNRTTKLNDGRKSYF